jgi:hypothetical protein
VQSSVRVGRVGRPPKHSCDVRCELCSHRVCGGGGDEDRAGSAHKLSSVGLNGMPSGMRQS